MKATIVAAGKELEKVPLTLSLTLSIEEWRALRPLISCDWPGWKITSLIGLALDKVDQSVRCLIDGKVEID
jgi:hypothetical protein